MFKKTLVALAVAAAAAPAMAAIDDATSGNGELFLAVSNWQAAEAQRVTYTFDTGITLADFLPSGSAPAALNAPIALTGWGSFLSALSGVGGSTADLRFSLIALDGTGTSSATQPGNKRLLTTSTLNAAGTIADGDGIGTALQNVDLTAITGVNSLQSFLNATNGLTNHSSTANGFSVNVRGGAVDAADYSNALLASLGFGGSQINFTTDTALGQQALFIYAANNNLPTAGGITYGNRVANVLDYAGTFSVLESGELVYSVAAIPEPGEWAFMLAGLSLAGMVARRRAARRA
jgi:hypothetical protein